MNRYCELKLVDILKDESHKSPEKLNKTTVNIKLNNMSTRNKLCDFSPRKNSFPNKTSVFMENKESRVSRKSNTYSGLNTCNRKVDADCRNLRKVSESKAEVGAEKRKRKGDKEKNIQEPPSKKIVTNKTSHKPIPNEADKIILQKKKKKKSRESFWENKLTGARRVSKRLSNLKMKRQKSLQNLGPSKSHMLMDNNQSIKFSSRGKITPNKETYRKTPTKRKSYDRNYPEVQHNFGKLSHTKRLYPKISAGRRPPTFTVTMKPQSSDQHYQGNEQFINTTCNEDTHNLDSPFSKDEKIIHDNINDGAQIEEIADSNINENNGVVTPLNDQSKFKEIDLESNTKDSSQECESLICNDEEFSDNSTIVIVDVESGENVEFGSSDEDKRGKEKYVSLISSDEEKPTKEQADDQVSGNETVNKLLVDIQEENINENYNLISVLSETNSSEVLVIEGTSSSSAADSGIDLQQVIETIEIANVKGEGE